MDCSLPGPSVQRILQARTLEWAAISFSIVGINSLLRNLDEHLPCWDTKEQAVTEDHETALGKLKKEFVVLEWAGGGQERKKGREANQENNLRQSSFSPFSIRSEPKDDPKLRNPGFPGGSVVKNPPASAGDVGLIPDLGRSHKPWSNRARAPQPLSLRSSAWNRSYWSPRAPEPVLCTKRSHRSEKPKHHN